ncbi:MAG: serine hydrolase family protein [Candidatus Micrarchaeota archaeon]|nr:serine hydrolase family protein [Candidatus Micrarchaeota archaeon]
MVRVIVVHRWYGNSACDWIPWLKAEMEKSGAEVVVPDMPNTNAPRIDQWVPFLKGVAGAVDGNTYFVGHSIGCQAVLRLLETLPDGTRAGGAVLVAPWINTLTNLSEGEPEIARPWLETPIKWGNIREHAGKIVDICSDDDPYVPSSEAEILKRELSAKIVLDQKRGHFTDEDDVTQLPVLLKELKALI